MNKLIQYIFLGIIQGITEPIPVSSSGHLLLIKTILSKFNHTLSIDFETLATITNFGSLVAIIIYFKKDIILLIKSFINYLFKNDYKKSTKLDFQYIIKIVIATIPAGVVGLIVSKLDLLTVLEENIKFLGCMLLLTALFLFLIKDFKGSKSRNEITFRDSLIIGLYQMISIIPGISRSGATIVGGMFRNLKREVSFNFSFILYIPISLATSLLGIKDLLELNIDLFTGICYFIAAILSFVFTYIFTKWFSNIVKNGKLIYFSIYCLFLGFIIILFL